ncbi:hypothetical protein Pan241w_15040 [Gimesia alba]|uniref:Uncharacterized protein n=1 Tax=Gimesia alba TaxID=2527973 RepID=A0A517RC77_9PLAN|nr:hypothetical protein Pan241w_15040 [Gimesia alba]
MQIHFIMTGWEAENKLVLLPFFSWHEIDEEKKGVVVKQRAASIVLWRRLD